MKCPICDFKGEFVPHGGYKLPKRPHAKCPECGSLERHRLAWLYLQGETDLFTPPVKRMLHVSPERCFRDLLAAHPNIDYLSAELDAEWEAMEIMDITDIRHPDGSFDVIYCSHVLEHVPDDHRALSEFFRVLRPGGWALLAVPIRGHITDEDPSVTTIIERRARFGQGNHVRWYGRDFKDRVENVGFGVVMDGYARRLGPGLMREYGLIPEDVYYCMKPAAQPSGSTRVRPRLARRTRGGLFGC